MLLISHHIVLAQIPRDFENNDEIDTRISGSPNGLRFLGWLGLPHFGLIIWETCFQSQMKNTSCLVFKWLVNFELSFVKPTSSIPADTTSAPRPVSLREDKDERQRTWGPSGACLLSVLKSTSALSSHTERQRLPGLFNSCLALLSSTVHKQQAQSELIVLKGTGKFYFVQKKNRYLCVCPALFQKECWDSQHH